MRRRTTIRPKGGTTMNHRHLVGAVVIAALSIGTSRLAIADTTSVTTCGQSVSGNAVLVADLDCSAGPDPAIDLASGARLYLQGFTLTADHTGVKCELGSCKIIGPGTIRRNALDGTDSTGVLGIRRAKLYSVTLENWDRGMFVLGPGDLRGSTVLNKYYGAMAGPLRATDTSFVGNYYGTRANEGTKDG